VGGVSIQPQYLSRAEQRFGDGVIFMEPVKAGRKGYHAVGKVEQITPDPRHADRFLE
jgi:putative restriction endonuclease